MEAEPAAFPEVRRREYPDARDGIYVNAASYGLLPRRAVDAVVRLTEARTSPGGFTDQELGDALSRARCATARLVGAEPEDVSLAPNTSYGVNMAARLVAQGPPGTIVVSHGEFPANVFPWMPLEEEGFRVERVPPDALGRPDEARLLERLRADDVRALALSSVQFSSGYRADLEVFGEACRERGVLFAVDAIQSLGAAPLDVRAAGVDVLACGAQKWLCSPWGSGFAYVAPEHRSSFDPPLVSWLGMEEALDFDRLLEYRYRFAPDGRKYELATLGIQDYLGMAHSIELFLELGVSTIRRYLLRLQEPLWRWIAETEGVVSVTPEPAPKRAGIVAFRVPGQARVVNRLEGAGVHFAVRDGAVRFAPHFYNTVEEIEQVVGVLEGAVATVRA